MSDFLNLSDVSALTAFSKIGYVILVCLPASLKFKKNWKTESQFENVEATEFLSSTISWSAELKVLNALRQSFRLRKPFLCGSSSEKSF